MINVAEVSGITIENLGEHGLKALRISNTFCDALIALQGAQILEFNIKHQSYTQALLWLSELNSYQPGKAIRGGIPLCFPWFGGHPEEKTYPSHGFARNLEWALVDAVYIQESGHQLIFELTDNAFTKAYWDVAFRLQMKIECGARLRLSLSLVNRDEKQIHYGFAWHSYFPVKIDEAAVYGLQGKAFIDQLDQHQHKIQREEAIYFSEEIDRIYPLTQGSFQLKANNRTTLLINSNAQSAVIWNPWIEKTARLADLKPESWRDFVCIEAGQIASQQQYLEAGQSVEYTLEISAV